MKLRSSQTPVPVSQADRRHKRMDRSLGLSATIIIVFTALVCGFATWQIFSGRWHYFFEQTDQEKLSGMADRLSIGAPFENFDGMVYEGVFVTQRGLQQRGRVPADWTGDPDVIRFSPEASIEPISLEVLVKETACGLFREMDLADLSYANFDHILVDDTGDVIRYVPVSNADCDDDVQPIAAPGQTLVVPLDE